MAKPKQRWARLWAVARPETDPPLRQGAWYPVVSETDSMVVVEVRRKHATVSRTMVELRDRLPERFTVVYRARNAAPNPAEGTRQDLGRTYAVCPECGRRVRVFGQPSQTRCSACGHAGDIAWWETG